MAISKALLIVNFPIPQFPNSIIPQFVSKLGTRPQGGESGGPISCLGFRI